MAVIHAAGFWGIPFSGQEVSAAEKASCMASSARSNDPEKRIKVARMRPDSCRKTRSAAAFASVFIRVSGDHPQGGFLCILHGLCTLLEFSCPIRSLHRD